MAKAWKGVLKDDASFAAMPELQEGLAVTLMGSADSAAKAAQPTVSTRALERGARRCAAVRSAACGCGQQAAAAVGGARVPPPPTPPTPPSPPSRALQVFVEDLPASAAANLGVHLPAGLANLGNTCYANSTLEALRAVPELKSSLLSYRGAPAPPAAAARRPATPYAPLTAGLGDLLGQLEAAREAVAPGALLTRVRGVFPQFGETDARGAHKQQDAEEFHNALMTALKAELTAPSAAVPRLDALGGGAGGGGNVVDTLFGVSFEETHTCKECPEEPPAVRVDVGHKLQCNIDGGAGKAVQINHLHEGVLHGLTGELEKHSPALGRNAVWSRRARLTRLPQYLTIQMMRFYWKATPDSRDHAGVKCKMLRPCSFPSESLDVYEWCAPALQAALKPARDAHADESMGGGGKKPRLDAAAGAGEAAMPVDEDGAAGGAAADPELAAALQLSMGAGPGDGAAAAAAASGGSAAATGFGPGVPQAFRGTYGACARDGPGAARGQAGRHEGSLARRRAVYRAGHNLPPPPIPPPAPAELYAVVTHKGRSADSGHYMAWVRTAAGSTRWLVYDDDAVSETDSEYVTMTLKGGGDDHSACRAGGQGREGGACVRVCVRACPQEQHLRARCVPCRPTPPTRTLQWPTCCSTGPRRRG